MEEFFKELEECLQGEVPESEIRDSIRYYRQYFAEERAAGRSESEIIQSLGSPRLIARSIIDAREAMEEREGYGEKDARKSGYYDTEQDDYNDYNNEEENPIQVKKLGGIKLVLVILLILIILGLLIRVLFPVVIIVVPVILVLRLLWGDRWR